MNKLQFIKSKLRVLALFSPEFGESPSFLTEVKIQSSHSSTQKYSPLQRVIFPLLGEVAGETNSTATAADVSGKATLAASKSSVQTGLGLWKWIPHDLRWYLVCEGDDLPTELITGHPKPWAFWTIQALQTFLFFYLFLCRVCLSVIVTARKTRNRQKPVLLLLLIISFEMMANFIWLITGPTYVSITAFSLSSKLLSLEAE